VTDPFINLLGKKGHIQQTSNIRFIPLLTRQYAFAHFFSHRAKSVVLWQNVWIVLAGCFWWLPSKTAWIVTVPCCTRPALHLLLHNFKSKNPKSWKKPLVDIFPIPNSNVSALISLETSTRSATVFHLYKWKVTGIQQLFFWPRITDYWCVCNNNWAEGKNNPWKIGLSYQQNVHATVIHLGFSDLFVYKG